MKIRPVGGGRTDRYDGYNICFSQLREWRLKMICFYWDVI